MDLTTLIWLIAIGFAAATMALVAVSLWPKSAASQEAGLADAGIVFLFDGRRLIDATTRAKRLLPQKLPGADDWTRFIVEFAPRFDGLEDRLSSLPEKTLLKLEETSASDAGMVLTAEWKDGLVRVSLEEQEETGMLPKQVERYALAAMQDELSTLRAVAERAPILTWRQRPDGTVIWANSAYMATAALVTPEGALMNWPPPVIFPDVKEASILTGGATGPSRDGKGQRLSVHDQNQKKDLWFDLVSVEEDNDLLCFACPMDNLVSAETNLSKFMQTLTKTFAHLTVGLAIFDRKRQLVMFNPALVDLSALPTEFLSKKPTLRTFLDALRDNQRVPEPKDYKSWRMQIAQLEAEAADGSFEETWTLPTGQTYKVRGRPYPDGAVAFMVEDISSDISLTRQFRSEIELSQSVINALDEAVGVFSPTNTLILTNPAFATLWDMDAGEALSEISLADAIAAWRAACRVGGGIDALEESLTSHGPRRVWRGTLSLQNGTRLSCQVKPIAGGNIMITFRPKIRRPEEAAGQVTQGVFMEG